MARTVLFLCSASVLLTAAMAEPSAEWRQFRGPNSNTAVPAGDYPTDLTLDGDLLWRVDLPGEGSSSPITLGDAIYVTCEIDGQDALACYGLDGTKRWERVFGPGRGPKHRTATGANPSPTTDGERVYCYYKSGRLVAVGLDGEPVWRRNLQEENGPDTLWWDLGTSPVLTPAGVLVAVMHEGDSYLVTHDRATGEVVWKQPRPFECAQESGQAYTTPIVLDDGARPTLLVYGADHLTGHDAMTGEQLFASATFNPNNEGMWRVIGSPTIDADVAVLSYGRGEFLSGVALERSGDEIAARLKWTLNDAGADVPCPVIADGLAYQLNEAGRVVCVEVATGRRLWSDKLPRSRAKYFTTPLLAGDRLYCLREDGVGHVVRAAAGLEEVGRIDLDDETVVTPVPVDGGRLLVRTRNRLYLFGQE